MRFAKQPDLQTLLSFPFLLLILKHYTSFLTYLFVAITKITSAKIIIYTSCCQKTATPSPFKRIERRHTIKYFAGVMFVIICTSGGMLSIGNINPDSNKDGIIEIRVPI